MSYPILGWQAPHLPAPQINQPIIAPISAPPSNQNIPNIQILQNLYSPPNHSGFAEGLSMVDKPNHSYYLNQGNELNHHVEISIPPRIPQSSITQQSTLNNQIIIQKPNLPEIDAPNGKVMNVHVPEKNIIGLVIKSKDKEISGSSDSEDKSKSSSNSSSEMAKPIKNSISSEDLKSSTPNLREINHCGKISIDASIDKSENKKVAGPYITQNYNGPSLDLPKNPNVVVKPNIPPEPSVSISPQIPRAPSKNLEQPDPQKSASDFIQKPVPKPGVARVAPENPFKNNQPGPDLNSQNNPGPQPVVSENAPAPNSICASCKLEDNLQKNILSCGCFIHSNCVKLCYERDLLAAKTKIPMLICYKCKKSIHFEFFDKVNNLEKNAKTNAKLLMFSHCTFRCPQDDKESIFSMLNKKFKARNKKCIHCDYNYCSFCSAKGGHRFFCDLLKDFKKGKLNEDNFIIK